MRVRRGADSAAADWAAGAGSVEAAGVVDAMRSTGATKR